MRNREVREKDLLDLGPAVRVAQDLDDVISGGRVYMDLKIPNAQYRCWDGRHWVSRSVSNYENSWTGDLDWRDHQVAAATGKFALSWNSDAGQKILSRIQGYLSDNGFITNYSADGSSLEFKANSPARVLYIDKYPHTNGTDFSIFDLKDRLKFISVFHQDLRSYKQARGQGSIVPWPDHQDVANPRNDLFVLPAKYKKLLTTDNAMKALRDNLVTIDQIATMPTYQHVRYLFSEGMKALREGLITVDMVAKMPLRAVTHRGSHVPYTIFAASQMDSTVSAKEMANSASGRKRPL